MNPHLRILAMAAAIACSFSASNAFAQPIDFNEVSLLVRAHESEPSIVSEVSRRKLLHPLTPQQETTLKGQGARDSLIQSLRRQDVAMSAADATAYETHRNQVQQAPRPNHDGNEDGAMNGPTVHVFNVAYGHPINLSQWGGLPYEIAFDSFRFAGEDHVEAVMNDQVRSVTEVSRPIRFTSEDEAFTHDWFPSNSVRNWRYTPYDTRGDQRDHRLAWNNDTVSVRSNYASRRLTIDWQNPVYIHGQPYAFYPVYGGGDVSLYYIGKANDRAARVAVVSR
ncbi:MAG: hypothetical protein ACJ8LI_11645 [Chthoniobacterales bacterium]